MHYHHHHSRPTWAADGPLNDREHLSNVLKKEEFLPLTYFAYFQRDLLHGTL